MDPSSNPHVGRLKIYVIAKTSVYLASSPEVEGVTEKYFSKGKETRSSETSYNMEAARRLWTVSEEQTGLKSEAPG
jgi:altronate dehydratase